MDFIRIPVFIRSLQICLESSHLQSSIGFPFNRNIRRKRGYPRTTRDRYFRYFSRVTLLIKTCAQLTVDGVCTECSIYYDSVGERRATRTMKYKGNELWARALFGIVSRKASSVAFLVNPFFPKLWRHGTRPPYHPMFCVSHEMNDHYSKQQQQHHQLWITFAFRTYCRVHHHLVTKNSSFLPQGIGGSHSVTNNMPPVAFPFLHII